MKREYDEVFAFRECPIQAESRVHSKRISHNTIRKGHSSALWGDLNSNFAAFYLDDLGKVI